MRDWIKEPKVGDIIENGNQISVVVAVQNGQAVVRTYRLAWESPVSQEHYCSVGETAKPLYLA